MRTFLLRHWRLSAMMGVALAAAPLTAGKVPVTSAATATRPLVIGHAGSAFFAPLNPFQPLPPNSLASLEQALARGADGLEVDVQLSADSVVMLYHDSRLETMSAGQGCVSQQPAAVLQQLPYRGGWPYDWYHDERLITLETLLARLYARRPLPCLHFDLHHEDLCNPAAPFKRAPALARALGQLLRRYEWPAERLLILSSHRPTLALLRQELPGVPLGYEITDNFAAGLRIAQAEKVQAVVVGKSIMTPECTAQAHAAGLQIVPFGGRSRGTVQRLLDCQPDAIQTDNVPVMRKLLGLPPTGAVTGVHTK